MSDLDDADRVATAPLGSAHQAAEVVIRCEQHVVGEEHRERLAGDEVATPQNRVAQAARLLLLDEVEARTARRVAEAVEVLAQQRLGGAHHHCDLGDPGSDRLVDRELDRRLGAERHELLGHHVTPGPHARAEPGRGDHRLAHHGVTIAKRPL